MTTAISRDRLDALCGGAPTYSDTCECGRKVGPYYSPESARHAMRNHRALRHGKSLPAIKETE